MTSPKTPTERPRRSVLYLPASNPRAILKARTLPADAVVLDLEDAVAPERRAEARAAAAAALAEGGFEAREVAVRVNGVGTVDFARDVETLRDAPLGAPVLLPKVEGAAALAALAERLPGRPLWAMVETCRGVLALPEIAGAAARLPLAALVVGTNDLAAEMGCRVGAGSRRPLWGALGQVVLAARAHGLLALDGVFNDFRDADGFEAEALEGAEFGFDGKTLIHPNQIEPANRLFSPGEAEVAFARQVVAAFERPENAGLGALAVDGRMVERLHLPGARRTLARAGNSAS